MGNGEIRVETVYSFITSTAPVDQKQAQRLFGTAWQQLRRTDPNFRELFDSVEKRNDSQVMAMAHVDSNDKFARHFIAWLEGRGIYLTNIKELMNDQLFFFKSESRNPRDGRSFEWMVGIYFEIVE